jgi:hypothetical protein
VLIPPMVNKTWRNDWLKLKSVKHKIKTLADARLKRCYHSAEPAQKMSRQAKRALFKSGIVAALHQSHCQWPPCHASAADVRSLIVRSGQDPNHVDFKVSKKVARSVTLL